MMLSVRSKRMRFDLTSGLKIARAVNAFAS
jgi:hypothetical protein